MLTSISQTLGLDCGIDGEEEEEEEEHSLAAYPEFIVTIPRLACKPLWNESRILMRIHFFFFLHHPTYALQPP